jgi:anti-sigma factor RsiW
MAWIPQYPDEGLSDEQRGAVEAHAATCDACRREIALVVGEADPGSLPEPGPLLERVLARIEAEPRGAGSAAPPRATPSVRAPRRAAPRWRRVAIAAGLVAVGVGLGSAAGWLAAESREPVYTTATTPGEAADLPLLDVVFRDDADVGRIRAALAAVQGEIVAGPTELGRFRVQLAPGVDATAAARRLAAESSGVAVFAEPVPR